MASVPINSWQTAGEKKMETDFLGLQSHCRQGLKPLN